MCVLSVRIRMLSWILSIKFNSTFQISKDDQGLPGFQQVCNLAEELLRLGDRLGNTSCVPVKDQLTLRGLHGDLHEGDKQPCVYDKRYTDESSGRFKRTTAPSKVRSGQAALEKSVLGGKLQSAALPDHSRLATEITKHLCKRHTNSQSRKDVKVNTASVIREYGKIKMFVHSNQALLELPGLQLARINEKTLQTW